MRRLLLAATTIAMAVLPTSALAHPALNPDRASTSSPTDAVLVIAHGCAADGGVAHDEEGALATIEVAVQLADGVLIEPGEIEGWDTAVDGQAVTWTDAGGATTDVLELPVTITLAPDAAPDYELTVFQQCEQDQFIRWTPGSQEYPALVLLTTGGGVDPDAGEASEEPVEDASDLDGEEPTEDHGDDAGSGEDDGDGDHGGVVTGEPLPGGAEALAGEPGDSFVTVAAIALAGLVVALLAGGLAAGRRSRP